MKKTKLLVILMASIFLVLGCANQTENSTALTTPVTFTDGLDRDISVTSFKKVGAASGSLAKIWTLAGGTLTAVTNDVFDDETIDLPEEIIDMGSLKDPSVETILAAELDLVFLVPGIKSHMQIADTLEKAGVQCVFIDIETFDDYLNTLNFFTDITGKKDLYEENGLNIQSSIEQTIETKKVTTSPKILLLRASESKVSVRDSNTMAGAMLKDLGCVNIADSQKSLLTDLSVEEIVTQQPEYIFVVSMGEVNEAKNQLEYMMSSNPIWATLDAVKNDKLIYLDKELFHLKPTTRWGESYEVLAEYLADEK
ncbi:MAG: ABC transporter substrate-binding protein [Anaerotignum sp.]